MQHWESEVQLNNANTIALVKEIGKFIRRKSGIGVENHLAPSKLYIQPNFSKDLLQETLGPENYPFLPPLDSTGRRNYFNHQHNINEVAF